MELTEMAEDRANGGKIDVQNATQSTELQSTSPHGNNEDRVPDKSSSECEFEHTNRNVGEYLCEFAGCDRVFAQLKRLTTHKRKHTGERPYVCREKNGNQMCGLSYTRVSHLKRHVDNVHLKIRIDCDQCPSTFHSTEAQKMHMKRHHSADGSRLKCQTCGREFKKKNLLRRHISVEHDKVDPYPCTECPKLDSEDFVRFKFPSQLKRHKARFHNQAVEPRSFVCSFCNEVFSSVSDRRRHRRTVHLHKNHICKKCGDNSPTFASHQNLLAHMQSAHPVDRVAIFKCTASPDCQKAYYAKRYLKQHVKNKHGSAPLPGTCQSQVKTSPQRQKVVKKTRRNKWIDTSAVQSLAVILSNRTVDG